ncbi:MAG: hypothetical protein WBG46_01830 [Nonlabens sp.]
MEFNADKVAVMTAGSEGIISSLWMLDHGSSTWSNTMDHAYLASQKDLAVKNLYLHNDKALKNLNDKIQNKLENLPKDDLGIKRFFNSSENSKVSMYASHPPNHDREKNAKSPFIPCEHDQRSAWILFDEKDKIQEYATDLIYSKYIGKESMQLFSDKEFQAFIKAESAGKELLEEYHNTFRDRFVSIPEEKDLEATDIKSQVKILTLSDIKKELSKLMEPVSKYERQLIELQAMAAGESRNKFFEYQGKNYKKKEVSEVFDQLVTAREDYFNSAFKDWDARFFAFHYHLAKGLNRKDELLGYYRQHKKLSSFYLNLVYGQKQIYSYITNLQSQSEVTQQVVNEVEMRIQSHFQEFNFNLSKFDEIKFIPLPNIHNVQDLKNSIVEGGNFMERGHGIFNSGKFDEMMQQLSSAINHLQRIDQRSMAVILTFHRELEKSRLSIPQTAQNDGPDVSIVKLPIVL